MDQRSEPFWNVKFCRDVYGFSNDVVHAMVGEVGPKILGNVFDYLGDQLYELPLYFLREELYRASDPMKHECPEFFEKLPVDAHILDYGCGTAEYARKHWYDLGRKATLLDVSNELKHYLEEKYRGFKDLSLEHEIQKGELFDAALCLDVLEHTHDPLSVTRTIHSALKPNAPLLVYFSTAYPCPGHILKTTLMLKGWLHLMHSLFYVSEVKNGLLWCTKRGDKP